MSIEASPGFTNAFVECFPSFRKDYKGIPKRRYFEKKMRDQLGDSIREVGSLYDCDLISYTRDQIDDYEREIITKFEKKILRFPWITLADIGEEKKIRDGLNANLKQGLISIVSGVLNLLGQGLVGKFKLAKVTISHTKTKVRDQFRRVTDISYRQLFNRGAWGFVPNSQYTVFLPDQFLVHVIIMEGTKQGFTLSLSHAALDRIIQFFTTEPDTLKIFEPVGTNAAVKGLSFAGDVLTDIIPGPIGAISTSLKMLIQAVFSIYAWRCDLELERMENHNWEQAELLNLRMNGQIAYQLLSDCFYLSKNLGAFEDLTNALGLTLLMRSKA